MNENIDQKSRKLKLVLSVAKEKHNNRREEIEGQSKKAELLFITTGFTFAGVTGLYQVDILNKANKQQILVIVVEFALIILFVILSWLWKRKEYDSPSISGMIDLYNENETINNIQIQLINAYKQAEDFNRKKLLGIATKMNMSFVIILFVYISIIIFILFPGFRFCIV